MPDVECGGIRLHYETAGNPVAPALVFSNSLGTGLDMWWRQLPAFTQDFFVLRYDARGHGQSSAPPGPYSIADLGRDVLCLLDGLEISRASFCGVSMGGMVGQWLGANAPSRLHKLVLASTAALIGTPEGWNHRIAEVHANGLASIVPALMERWFTADFRRTHPAETARVAAMLTETNPEGYAACCAAIRDMDQRGTAANITAPTLVVCGTHDPVTPPEQADFLARQIAGSQALALPAAHLSNVECAETFNRRVHAFLRHDHLET